MQPGVQDLPEELLVIIFTLLLEHSPLRHSHCRTSLALVSQQWHSIIYHTPSLWTTIHHNHDDVGRGISLALQRSLKRPLDVTFQHEHYDLETHQRTHESFKEVCKTITRWRTAALGLWPKDNVLPLIATPAPLLEAVDVDLYPHTQDTYFVNLFQGRAERLQAIRLSKVAIPWNSAILSNLRRLELILIRFPGVGPTVDEILSILSSCPHLSVLTLDRVDIPPELPPRDTPIIRLPELTDLELTSLGSSVTEYLLHQIEGVPCRSVNVDSSLLGIHPPSLLQGMKSFAPRSYDGMVEVDLWSDYMSCTVKSGSHQPFRLILYQLQALTATVLTQVASVVGPEVLALDAKVIVQETSDGMDGLLDAAAAFNVIALDVRDPDDTQGVLEYLGAPASVEGVAHWRLPALRDLTIIGDPDDVAEMVEARSAKGVGLDGSSCAPLRTHNVNCGGSIGLSSDHPMVACMLSEQGNVMWQTLPDDDADEENML